MVLKELILNSFYFGTVWWSWKNWFWTVFTLWQCGGRCGGVVIIKELILNGFYFGKVWCSWKNWFWTVCTLEGCGGLQRTHFEQFLLWDSCGGHERTDFEQFLLWEGVVVLKELILNSFYFGTVVVVMKGLILNSFYFGRVWWSSKNRFWTVSTLEECGDRCGGLERTDFEQFLLWDSVVVFKELILNSFYFGKVWWSSKNWFWPWFPL